MSHDEPTNPKLRGVEASTPAQAPPEHLRIWATLDNDFPKRTKYVQICQDLSGSSAQQFLAAARGGFSEVAASKIQLQPQAWWFKEYSIGPVHGQPRQLMAGEYNKGQVLPVTGFK